MSSSRTTQQRRLAHILSAVEVPSLFSPAAASAVAPSEIADAQEYRASAFADMLPQLSAPGATPERLKHLYDHGFVIVDDFVDSPWISALREAGRRVTEACAPEHAYAKIDSSKGYVHRAGAEQEPWAIRGLIHPAWREPVFAEFHGSPEFTGFVESWCDDWSKEQAVLGGMLLWCNPRRVENGPSWHRDTTWWGTGKGYFAQREVRGEGPEAYSEETERARWKEITDAHAKAQTSPRAGVSMFLALVDDECHELIPGTHTRWRTAYEHDVLLPQGMKDQGVPFTPSWNKTDPLPGSVAIRLKPGQALIRNGTTIHTGHTVPGRERNTLSIGWSKWCVTAPHVLLLFAKTPGR